jgi:hypothetical protein
MAAPLRPAPEPVPPAGPPELAAPFADSVLLPSGVSAELLLVCFPGRKATTSTMAITVRMKG